MRRRSAVFKGPTRNARVLSEGWVAANAFCPGCGATPLTAFAADAPVADVHCGVCAEDDELKAAGGRTDAKLVNGAWGAMTARTLTPLPVGEGLRLAERSDAAKPKG